MTASVASVQPVIVCSFARGAEATYYCRCAAANASRAGNKKHLVDGVKVERRRRRSPAVRAPTFLLLALVGCRPQCRLLHSCYWHWSGVARNAGSCIPAIGIVGARIAGDSLFEISGQRFEEVVFVDAMPIHGFRLRTPHRNDEIRVRVDEHELAEDSNRRITSPVQRPQHVAVIDALAAHHLRCARLIDPAIRENALAVDNAVVQQEQAESCIVAQRCGQAAAADFESVRRLQPPVGTPKSSKPVASPAKISG